MIAFVRTQWVISPHQIFKKSILSCFLCVYCESLILLFIMRTPSFPSTIIEKTIISRGNFQHHCLWSAGFMFVWFTSRRFDLFHWILCHFSAKILFQLQRFCSTWWRQHTNPCFAYFCSRLLCKFNLLFVSEWFPFLWIMSIVFW